MVGRRQNFRSKRKTNKSGLEKEYKAIAIFAVALILLATFLVKVFLAQTEQGQIDGHYCRKDSLPEIVAVVIDHTDSINTVQKASIETRLLDASNEVKKNGAVRFYSVEEIGKETLQADIDLCHPGDEREVDKLSGNKRLAKKRYEEKFSSILKEGLSGMLGANEASQSPIMEAAQSVVVTAFHGRENKSASKKLILVSDLLEHTNKFSLYNGVPNFEEYAKSPHWASVKSDMKGVDVELLYLHRENAASIQTPKLKIFWQMYFLEQGASSVKFTPVEG